MDIDILKNIFLLFVILCLFLVISNDENFNIYLKKSKMNYLILLILIYFVYIEIPLSIIIIFLLVILLLNKQFYMKYLKENKYLKDYLPDLENFSNSNNNQILNTSTNLENFDFKPFEETIIQEENNKNDNNENNNEMNDNNENFNLKEPFKTQVQEIKNHLNNAINFK